MVVGAAIEEGEREKVLSFCFEDNSGELKDDDFAFTVLLLPLVAVVVVVVVSSVLFLLHSITKSPSRFTTKFFSTSKLSCTRQSQNIIK